MGTFLFVLGCIGIAAGLIAGFLSGSVGGFFLCLLGGVTSSAIYFALAKLLENQSEIVCQLRRLRETERHKAEKITCKKCGRQYDSDMSYCSWCGNREN